MLITRQNLPIVFENFQINPKSANISKDDPCVLHGFRCRKVHSILVQLPLPDHIDSPLVLSKIRVDKDPGGRPGEVTGISDGQPPKDGWLMVTGTFSIFSIYWE